MPYTNDELLLAHYVRERAGAVRKRELEAAQAANNTTRFPEFKFEGDPDDSIEARYAEERQLRKEWDKGHAEFQAKKAAFADDWLRQHPLTDFVPEAVRLLVEVADIVKSLR